jgi:isopenicillin N synthase-like dioxygenase
MLICRQESYEVGSDENEIQYNIWLPEEVFPGFRDFTTKFYWELNKTAMFILDALILSLELTEDEAKSVRALHSGHDNQLRLLHYPLIESSLLKDQYASRLGAHTDWSAFTLLFQDTHGGLQFLDRASGYFIDAVPKEGVLYMNIGDMFQRISNGMSNSCSEYLSMCLLTSLNCRLLPISSASCSRQGRGKGTLLYPIFCATRLT